MARPKTSYLDLLEIARRTPDSETNAKKLRIAAEGGAHDRISTVQLARAIETGRESAARLPELPTELRDAVARQLPDLGPQALASLADDDPNALNPHTMAVVIYTLATQLQQAAEDSGHRQIRRILEDSERHVNGLKMELAARDRLLQSAQERADALSAEAERTNEVLGQLSAENGALASQVSQLQLERRVLESELARSAARMVEVERRDVSELVLVVRDLLCRSAPAAGSKAVDPSHA